MEYNILGRTGLSVSRVGFGGGGIGQVWGSTTRDEAVRAVHRALDLGVNFFDVAPAYGDGKAEEALGLALEGRTEDVIVATKVRLAAGDMADVTGAVLTDAIMYRADLRGVVGLDAVRDLGTVRRRNV